MSLKVDVFLCYPCRTQARGRVGRRSSCSFERSLLRRQALSFVHAWRKGLGSLLSYPLLVATLCFNPAKDPQTASRSAECRPAELPYVLTLDLCIHGGPPNVDFTLTLRLVHVWIRIRLSMMAIVFVFSVWIRRLRPIFPLSQVELCLAVRERWLTAANFDRRSHCSGTMPNFYFREARQLWTLYRHPMPCDFF